MLCDDFWCCPNRQRLQYGRSFICPQATGNDLVYFWLEMFKTKNEGISKLNGANMPSTNETIALWKITVIPVLKRQIMLRMFLPPVLKWVKIRFWLYVSRIWNIEFEQSCLCIKYVAFLHKEYPHLIFWEVLCLYTIWKGQSIFIAFGNFHYFWFLA